MSFDMEAEVLILFLFSLNQDLTSIQALQASLTSSFNSSNVIYNKDFKPGRIKSLNKNYFILIISIQVKLVFSSPANEGSWWIRLRNVAQSRMVAQKRGTGIRLNCCRIGQETLTQIHGALGAIHFEPLFTKRNDHSTNSSMTIHGNALGGDVIIINLLHASHSKNYQI